ncbi:hypothetical protein, partial [Klebsiella pneumoniae]|uniref:hypothetical protein n=1 Tax=Klebsiella pneumoniae TaxID=573 RepID=UPI0039C10294
PDRVKGVAVFASKVLPDKGLEWGKFSGVSTGGKRKPQEAPRGRTGASFVQPEPLQTIIPNLNFQSKFFPDKFFVELDRTYQ